MFVAMTFLVIVTTGLLAFFLPFSITVTGLHALMGFLFIGLIGLHVHHNFKGLKRSIKNRYFWLVLLTTALLTALFIWQPTPVKKILRLSNNIGSALDLFQMQDNGFIYRYTPAENYKMKLEIRGGLKYDKSKPPKIAIWLENMSSYHIKTLYNDNEKNSLPYWAYKVKEYENAKKEAKKKPPEKVDAISSATPNASFDPRDYILPKRNTQPFYLLIEVNHTGDANQYYKDQPSLIYKVEIDNKDSKIFQVLDMVGYSKFDDKENSWDAYYADEKITTARELIDSALLTIER
jgi:hypothetical protein